MTQQAIVTEILDERTAEVTVTRKTACGGNCSGCETCLLSETIKVSALNPIRAEKGQYVEIESSSSKLFSAMLLVYLMPLIFMLVCFFTAYALKLKENVCVLVSLLGLLLSAAVLLLIIKRKSPVSDMTYTISRILEEV